MEAIAYLKYVDGLWVYDMWAESVAAPKYSKCPNLCFRLNMRYFGEELTNGPMFHMGRQVGQ